MTRLNAPPILIAEDDPDDAFLLRRTFVKAQVANPLVFVGDGDEAIRYLSGLERFSAHEEQPWPVVLFLDLKMPRRNGFELLEWLREQPPFGGLPVVVLTSSREPADVTRAYELGANAYLVKPSTPNDLLATVRGLVADGIILSEPPEVER